LSNNKHHEVFGPLRGDVLLGRPVFAFEVRLVQRAVLWGIPHEINFAFQHSGVFLCLATALRSFSQAGFRTNATGTLRTAQLFSKTTHLKHGKINLLF